MNGANIGNCSQIINVQLLRMIMRMLFRVYDVSHVGELERAKMERLMLLAYGGNLTIPHIRRYIHIFVYASTHVFKRLIFTSR